MVPPALEDPFCPRADGTGLAVPARWRVQHEFPEPHRDLLEEIAAIKARIVRAESDRDTWRACGAQDKYLEACSMVEALGLQLELMRRVTRS